MGVKEANLSRKDRKILQFAAQSGGMGLERLTVEQISKGTGCSADFIYKRLADPDFKTLFFETLKTSLAVETPAILKTFVEAAKSGSFKHGKLILELAGLYSEEANLNLKTKVELGESPFKSEEAKVNFIKATLGKYLTEESQNG